MKEKKILAKAFGKNELGLVDYPKKISGIQISGISFGDCLCSSCRRSYKWHNIQRSWKTHRKTQWKE